MSPTHRLSHAFLSLTGFAGLLAAQNPPPPPTPPVETHQAIQGTEVVRETLKPQEPVFTEGGGNSWFPKTRKDLGTYFDEEEAIGVFPFHNPSKEEHKLNNFLASCQCSKAVLRVGDRVYELTTDPAPNSLYRVWRTKEGAENRERVLYATVGPEESGTVEVHMKMQGFQGGKDAHLDFQTTDPKEPAMKLSWRATGAVYFTVEPPDIHLNEMSWQDKREFTCRITSGLQPNFDITALESKPDKCEVRYEKQVVDGKATWVVSATYGPGVDERAGGGEIRFKTNVKDKSVSVRFSALVRGPLKMNPSGFFSLGAIKQGVGATQTVHLWPTDEFDLQAPSVEVKDLSVKPEFVVVRTSKVTDFVDPETKQPVKNAVRVEVIVSPDAPRAVVRGKVVIQLNHPAAPTKELMFNGFVR